MGFSKEHTDGNHVQMTTLKGLVELIELIGRGSTLERFGSTSHSSPERQLLIDLGGLLEFGTLAAARVAGNASDVGGAGPPFGVLSINRLGCHVDELGGTWVRRAQKRI